MSFLMWMPKKYGIAVVITEVKHILLTDFIKNVMLPFLKHHFRKKKTLFQKPLLKDMNYIQKNEHIFSTQPDKFSYQTLTQRALRSKQTIRILCVLSGETLLHSLFRTSNGVINGNRKHDWIKKVNRTKKP